MSRYDGDQTKAGPVVTVDGNPLEPRLDLRNHSPNGFEWGHSGGGAAQLALAILADHLGDDEQALNLYQRFKSAVIADLRSHWTLTSRRIDQVLKTIIREDSLGGSS